MKRTGIAFASLLAISACETRNTNPIVGDVFGTTSESIMETLKCGDIDKATAARFSISAACVGLDVLKTVNTRKSGIDVIDAASATDFDKTLYLALKDAPSTVTVNFTGDDISLDKLEKISEPAPADPPIFYWLDRVSDTGGKNVPCRETAPEGLLSALADILFGVIVGQIDDWVTYRPAKEYNTLVVFDSAVEGRPIRSVKFIPRSNGLPVCPTSPAPASE